jgi:hypothetical protein
MCYIYIKCSLLDSIQAWQLTGSQRFAGYLLSHGTHVFISHFLAEVITSSLQLILYIVILSPEKNNVNEIRCFIWTVM